MIIRQPKQSEMKALYEAFRKYGDIPTSEVRKATSPKTRKQWLVVIDNGKIIGAGRTHKTDWYEWTVKNIFTIPSERNKGKKIATLLYAKLTDKAKAEGAKVAEADITSTNVASKIAAARAGMKPVNNFVGSSSEPHADIYHEVFYPPTHKQVKSVNKKIRLDFSQRKKPLVPNVLSLQPLFTKPKKRK